jgi:hypothetical protein
MPSTKVVKIPSKQINVTDESGKITGSQSVFSHLMAHVIEQTQQKNDTDTFLAHSLREKLESINGDASIELEESEIHFLKQGVEQLRQKGVSGSGWYYFVKPLQEAEDKKALIREEKASVKQ